MPHKVLQKMDEIFNYPDKFTKENLEDLVNEVKKHLNELQLRMQSTDETVRQEAFREANEIQLRLQEHALATCAPMGIAPETLKSQFKEKKTPTVLKKRPKTVKHWLVG